MMICTKCEKKRMQRRKATHEKPYHYSESGLDNILLTGIYVYDCPKCAETVPEIPNMVQLHDKIAEGLVTKPDLLSGPEIRFLRKNLRLKASDFAEFLQTTPVSVSRWETGEQEVSKENDRLIRYFYLRKKEEITDRRIKQAWVGQLRPVEPQPKPLVMNVEVNRKGELSAVFAEAVAAV
jgi:putative zinc finger/helix-turn-helix YgiT family protein